MITDIFRRQSKVTLSFDCLIPEEAHKILNCMFAEDMDETMSLCDLELSYGTSGYRPGKDGQKIWSHELVIIISTDFGDEEKDIDSAIDLLREIRERVLKVTGIVEDE